MAEIQVTPAPTSAETPAETPVESAQSTKRPAPETESTGGDQKRQKKEPIPERDVKAIRTQLEYYLSDKNLIQDEFFYDIIKSSDTGSIPFEKLLSCRKLTLMKADEELIKSAAKDSSLIELQGDGVRRKDNAPLPEFVGRPERKGFKSGGLRPQNKHIKPVLIHANGVVVAVRDLHEDTPWSAVKETVNALLKPHYEGMKTLKGSDMAPVNFCGQRSPRGVAHLILSRKPGIMDRLKEISEIEIDGDKFPFSIENDQHSAQMFFKTLPKQMMKSLGPRPFNPPVTIGANNSAFESLDHLKKCCKELLDITPLDAELSGNGLDVLKSLLSYHPNAEKSRNLKSIKVGLHESSTETNPVRSFFAVKESGASEDFSYIKCLSAFTTKLIDKETEKMDDPVEEDEAPAKSEAATEESAANEVTDTTAEQ